MAINQFNGLFESFLYQFTQCQYSIIGHELSRFLLKGRVEALFKQFAIIACIDLAEPAVEYRANVSSR